MATKKPSPKQLAARAKFAAMAKSGALARKRAKTKTPVRAKNPVKARARKIPTGRAIQLAGPFYAVEYSRDNKEWSLHDLFAQRTPATAEAHSYAEKHPSVWVRVRDIHAS